jgi:hypothetical protein
LLSTGLLKWNHILFALETNQDKQEAHINDYTINNSKAVNIDSESSKRSTYWFPPNPYLYAESL